MTAADLYNSSDLLYCSTASSWGKPQGLAFRDGFLHEALDEMSTPPTKKNDTM